MTRNLQTYKFRIQTLRRYSLLLLSVCCFWLAIAQPGQAHWDDLATAEITLPAINQLDLSNRLSTGLPDTPTEAEIALTYPTTFTAFADDDASGQLSKQEIARHHTQLQTFFEDRIQLKNGLNQPAALTVRQLSGVEPSSGQVAPNTHTRLQLSYIWTTAVQSIEINYDLFVEAPQATCLATISQAGKFTSHVFTPQKTTLLLTRRESFFSSGKWGLALVGVFAWGAAHSMSPGHGKTLVSAYLVGERATPIHAVFLATVTTITHTVGVFALGLVTLFAARYILPEQLYPWLSLVSGCTVIAVGSSLLWQRWRRHNKHSHHGHSHHKHSHHGHSHSHLPASGEPVTWRSLLFLGFSAGLVPCPAALVLLLSAIALGNPLSGLILVLVFSLGLSLVLTVLGLLLVYAKQLFKHLPSAQQSWIRWLPIASAIGIIAIGVGISTRSLLQVF